MNNHNGALDFEATINSINFNANLAAMERRVLGFTNTAQRETSKLDQSFNRLGQLAVGAFAFTGLAQLPQQILQVRGQFEQLEIAFSSMLKSKVKADALLKDLVQTAATTPFGLKDIASGAKQLLAYGSSAGSVVKEIRMLGDVASGVSVPIGDLIYLFGTLRSQGRAYAVDIRQFAGRGIPIYEELSKVLSVNVDQVAKFVEEGKVGFKEVEQAFKNMTSSGGLFAGLMDAQSKSLLGLKERLSDAWDVMLNEIGKKNQDVAAELLTTATDVVAHYQDVVDIIKVVVSAYGSYRAALLLVSVAQKANLVFTQTMALQQGLATLSGTVLSASQLRLAASTSLLSRAQAALNATMLANPYILIGTALASLVTYAVLFEEESKKLKTSQELLAESSKDVESSFNKQQGEIRTLVGVIQNQNVAESERIKAYDRLKSIAPEIIANLDFQKAKTADLTAAVNQYIVSLRKRIQLESGQNKAKVAYDQQAEAAERLKKAEEGVIANRGKNYRMVLGPGDINGPTLALSDSQRAQQKLEEARKYKEKSDRIVNEVEANLAKIYGGTSTKEELQANIDRQVRVLASLPDKLSASYKAAEDELKRNQEELAKLNKTPIEGPTFSERLAKAETAGALKTIKALADTDDKLEEFQKKVKEKLGSAINGSKEKAQLEQLNKDINTSLGKKTKAQRDAEKVGPLGSISYYENIIKLAEEAQSKIPKTNTVGIEKQKQIIVNAQEEIERIRKLTAIRSFDEELTDKKSAYELYQKWVTAYGKQAADKQFSELIKSGQSYVDYLNTQIANLENERDNAGLSDKQAQNLSSLIDQRNEATGKKTAIQVFQEDLEKARVSAGNLADYLVILKQKQDELNTKNDTSPEASRIRQETAEEIVRTQQQLREQLGQYLREVEGSEVQRLAVQKKYAELRFALEEEYRNKTKDKGYTAALIEINKGEAAEIKAIRERTTQASAAFKKLDEVIVESGRASMKKRLEVLNDYLKKEEAAKDTETYKQKLKERNDLVIDIKSDDLARVDEYGRLVGELGNAFAELGGTAGEVGGLFSGMASQINLVTKSFKENLEAADAVQIGLQAAVTIIGVLTSAAAQRKKAETEYYQSIIAQQQEYNLLLNEQVGLRSKKDENIFVRNYDGELKDQFDKFDFAQKKYEESLKKLNEGRAKIDQKNVVDWGAVGKTAGAGAAIGSIIPGIGTAIGAVVGGLIGGAIGLFGGKKSESEFGSLLERYPQLIQKSKDGVDELNESLAQTLINQGLVDDATKQLLQSTIEWQKQMEEAKEAVKAIARELVGNVGDKLRDGLVNAFREGKDAALDFKKTLEELIEDFVSKLLFSKVFGPLFDEFGKGIEKSLAPGGDGRIDDDAAKFYSKLPELTKVYNQGLEAAQQAAKAVGFDIFKPQEKQQNSNSMGQAIQAVSETTANVLAGQINAMRLHVADTNNMVRQQLLVLSGIEKNTARLEQTNITLVSIDKRLQNMERDPMRGIGGTQPG